MYLCILSVEKTRNQSGIVALLLDLLFPGNKCCIKLVILKATKFQFIDEGTMKEHCASTQDYFNSLEMGVTTRLVFVSPPLSLVVPFSRASSDEHINANVVNVFPSPISCYMSESKYWFVGMVIHLLGFHLSRGPGLHKSCQ